MHRAVSLRSLGVLERAGENMVDYGFEQAALCILRPGELFPQDGRTRSLAHPLLRRYAVARRGVAMEREFA